MAIGNLASNDVATQTASEPSIGATLGEDPAHDPTPPSAWERAHRALSRLARQRAAADAEEARTLVAALRSAVHVHLGFATFGEYLEWLFGYSRRQTQEKVRVAEALEDLPALANALERGALGWSAVRELTRVASPQTEGEWLEFARGKSVRQLEQVVANARPSDTPSGARPPEPQRRMLRFEVMPETFATFREALRQLRRNADERWDDDAALLAMARLALSGPREEGLASYQVALTVCPECRRGAQHGNGELIAVGADVVAMAACDARQLGLVPAPVAAGREPARTDANRRSPPDRLTPANDHAAMDESTSGGERDNDPTPGERQPSAPPLGLEPDAHVGTRTTQTIPPAVRRAVLHRDQHRCRVPNCRNATFLDLHHVRARSAGGRHNLENIVTLCGAHHRAVHRGDLIIDGDSAAALRFRHADGRCYGDVQRPETLDVAAKVFSALCQLGFRDAEVRAVLAELRTGKESPAPCASSLLREALSRLGPRITSVH